MNTIGLQELQQNPAALMERVEAGETLQIVHGGRTVAEIRPVEQLASGLRPIGLCMGEFVVPDDFDAPLSDEVLREFEGS